MLQYSVGSETGCFVLKDRAIASLNTSQIIIRTRRHVFTLELSNSQSFSQCIFGKICQGVQKIKFSMLLFSYPVYNPFLYSH